MTIGAWIGLFFIIVCGVIVTGLCIWWGVETKKAIAYWCAVGAFVLTVAISAIFIWYRMTSASGRRVLKDQQSNLNGGIERVVSVYDIDGDLIAQYSGKFDIETDRESYILFDDEQGKRHIIYYTTGTIIVDEK